MKTLDGPDLRERLVSRRHRLGDAILHAGTRLPQPMSEQERRANDDRNDSERRRRESRMGEGQQDETADEKQNLSRHLGDPRAEQRLQYREVGRETTRELARAPLSVEAW